LYGLLEAIKKTETRKVHKQCNERLRHENSVIKACSKFDLGYAALGGLELNWICAHTTELELLSVHLWEEAYSLLGRTMLQRVRIAG